MSDEKEAAVRRAADAIAKRESQPFPTHRAIAYAALNASGVWERIEELERENERMREAPKAIARAEALPHWARQTARAALAETQENAG